MRSLLLLSLLALGTDSHSIGYRNNLLAYAPARGEFPVQSERAQSYVRYLDNSGAERLLAFTYPEPLFGVRSTEQVNPQLRSSSGGSSISKEKQLQSQFASFRDWCEQRYNALRTELDRLRAEGQQPSPSILAQYEPLEEIIKMNAFEPVPGLTPEVQRARDEHLRIWYETRLQALKAGAGLPKTPQLPTIKTQPIANIPEIQPEKPLLNRTKLPAFLTLIAPKPVQETDEVFRAREKHLQLYNEALKKLPQPNRPQAQTQTQPQPQTEPQPQLQPKDPQIQEPLNLLPLPLLPTARPQQQPQDPQSQLPLGQLGEAEAEPQQQPERDTNTKPIVPLPVAFFPISVPNPQPLLPTARPQLQPQDPQSQLPLEQLGEAEAEPQQQPEKDTNTKPIVPLPVAFFPISVPNPQPLLPTARPQLQPQDPQSQLPLEQFGVAEAERQQQPEKDTNTKPIVPLPVPNFPSTIPLIYLPQPTTTIKVNEQQIQQLQKDKLMAEDQLADIEDKIRDEERERDEKRQQEKDRLEELRLAELEAQREEQRILEEQRRLEAERISLQQAELQRCQNERLAEAKRLQAEQLELQQRLQMIGPIQTPADQQIKLIGQQQPQPQFQSQPQPQTITQQQQVQNSFILRIQTPGQTFTDAFVRQPNPFLKNLIQNPQLQEPQAQATLKTIPSSEPAPSDSTSSTTAFSELERARREHFKAHEMALEQLRQSNIMDAKLIP
ncbi:mediator of RNA polymerase II transcription subunit 15 [Drosophila grimshawi]|uniref:GH20369 n=1 Tax=Drosophila grimshawi TaxID=7222 RepID=B4J4B3_DROGR|nr:mediator of RNA polymerase II transcription subunit 15 [Drosophila grimshawi]EDW01595.1 GH20369 [Drosophila grimshawi]